jgi:hypothetical protein
MLIFICFCSIVRAIETREGWPLLTVETEVNGDSKSTNEKGVPPWLVRCAGTIDFCSALAALVGPREPQLVCTFGYNRTPSSVLYEVLV